MQRIRTVIMGAAGRDFHDFQTVYRDDPSTEVVAFTATQIPGIDGRRFPADLAGPLYPEGIPVLPEDDLVRLIRDEHVSRVVFAYSDMSHIEVMHRASLVLAEGADFVLLGADRTMIAADVPVISVCAVRTGVGKSGISRRVCDLLRERGLTAVDIRHPMPYRELSLMRVERYGSLADLDAYGCTIEEREEYEHLIEAGITVFAGVDYEAIVKAAQAEADVIVWDGGNNDLPFVRPDLEIVAIDPHRPGHERLYHPGEANFLRADVLVINKVDSARPADVEALRDTAALFNPTATVVLTDSRITVEDGPDLNGKRVLVIEDGPTLTHGGMAYGAGALAARESGATLVDPRPYAVGSLRGVFEAYPHLTDVLPAMGYSAAQLTDLERTVAATPCDIVVVATPIDLSHLIRIDTPHVRVGYLVEDHGDPTLGSVLDAFLARTGRSGTRVTP
ncbi:MAG: cyclic 2,3-diphosphoglycerate synthase [Coriobacteriia bacterium]